MNNKWDILTETLRTFQPDSNKVQKLCPMPQWWRSHSLERLINECMKTNQHLGNYLTGHHSGPWAGLHPLAKTPTFHIDDDGKSGILVACSSSPTEYVQTTRTEHTLQNRRHWETLKVRTIEPMALYWMPPGTVHRQPLSGVSKSRQFFRIFVFPETRP